MSYPTAGELRRAGLWVPEDTPDWWQFVPAKQAIEYTIKQVHELMPHYSLSWLERPANWRKLGGKRVGGHVVFPAAVIEARRNGTAKR
jgi:hypothetical protein